MDDATASRIDECALSHAKQIAAIDRLKLPGGDLQFTAMVQVIMIDAIKNAWFSPDVKVASADTGSLNRWVFIAHWDVASQMYLTYDPIQPALAKGAQS